MEIFISIDVEAAANGYGHNDRVPCWVAIVNYAEQVIYNKVIKVESMVSPLTLVTGLTAHQIQQGESFDVVRNEVRRFLGPNVVLVGQNPKSDIEWLQLRAGVDYKRVIDLADVFKTWNIKYGKYDKYSLAKEAYALLGVHMHGAGATHDPAEDAKISMRLYKRFGLNASDRDRAKQTLQRMTYTKSFPSSLMSKSRPDQIDGVCSSKFNSTYCSCGQPIG